MAQIPRKASYSSVAALAMARAQKRVAAKYEDQDLAGRAESLERRAEQAIKDGKADLPPLN